MCGLELSVLRAEVLKHLIRQGRHTLGRRPVREGVRVGWGVFFGVGFMTDDGLYTFLSLFDKTSLFFSGGHDMMNDESDESTRNGRRTIYK